MSKDLKINHSKDEKNIVIKNVSKNFGNVKAVDDVTLEVKDGEFVSLLGSSGCGKTTTLRMVAGFERADSGSIFIGKSEITHLFPYKRKIGMVFQNYAIWPHMTVKEHLLFGLKINKVEPEKIKRRIEETIDLTDLCGLEDRYPRELSGGQQQRVALARALALSPRVLLLDEPLSNLDKKLRVEMRVELRKLQKKLNMTSLYVTHDQEEALSMSDRIAIMDNGKIIQVGTPYEIYEKPVSAYVAAFMGNENILTVEIEKIINNKILFKLNSKNYFNVSSINLKERSLKIGDKIKLVIRPETIKILNDPSKEENVGEGKINYIDYFGVSTKYIIRMNDNYNLVVVQNQFDQIARHDVGEKVYLKLGENYFNIVK